MACKYVALEKFGLLYSMTTSTIKVKLHIHLILLSFLRNGSILNNPKICHYQHFSLAFFELVCMEPEWYI